MFVSTVKVQAEPPGGNGNTIVSQRLLNRVADILASGGDGSSRGGDESQNIEGPSIVDQPLLDRIARIISQNDGQLSWSQKSHAKSDQGQQSSVPQQEHGVPPTEVPETARELVGTQFELSPPELVPRIASFDITGDDDDGGYPVSPQVPQDSYADNRGYYQHQQQNGRPELGQLETALRIASFDIEGQQAPAAYTPPQGRAYSNTG